MDNELINNLLKKSKSITYYMRSGRYWTFKTEDITRCICSGGVIGFSLKTKKEFFIIDKEIESVSLVLKENETSE